MDSNFGFAFKKPATETLKGPQFFKGAEGFLEAKGILSPAMKNAYMNQMQVHPLGPMLRDVSVIKYVTGDPLNVEVTDETTSELAEEIVRNMMIAAGASDPSDEEVRARRKRMISSLVGFERLLHHNEFAVYVYDKSKLKGVPIKHSLANFAVMMMGGMALTVDQLAADERSVLTGASFSLSNASVNGVSKDFRIDRLGLITESKDRYYMVELAFSPQSESSVKVWSELDAMLKSFVVLE
jgi:hypothetical protein